MDIAVTDISPKQSSREGARIHGLVLHTTQGSDSPDGNQDLKNLGALFHNEEASAHIGVNVRGKFGRYVEDSFKAWAVCNYNQITLSLEQIGFAEFSRSEWFKRHDQLHGASEFIVYGHVHYGVSIRKGQCANGAITRDGVFQHRDLGIVGSGHVDCGPGYPQEYVELLARFFIAHKLHPSGPHTERLRKEINNIRHVHGIKPIPAN